jgi:hypothetical protein
MITIAVLGAAGEVLDPDDDVPEPRVPHDDHQVGIVNTC